MGGDPISYHLDQGFTLNDFKPYLPLDINKIKESKIESKFLGYYLKWVPQENFYYAVNNTGFQPNEKRIDGTYQKYASIDDKTDGFFYYTRWIKFAVGRATMDSAQEIRNQHITKEEGLALINRYEGEYPSRYEKEFLEYIGFTRDEFLDLCDEFRSPHLWKIEDNEWKLRHNPK